MSFEMHNTVSLRESRSVDPSRFKILRNPYPTKGNPQYVTVT